MRLCHQSDEMKKYLGLLLITCAVCASGSPFWKKITKKDFNNFYNDELLNAYEQDPTYANQIQLIKNSKNSTKGVTLENTVFKLYTRENLNGVRVNLNDTDSLEKGLFDPKKKTVFLTHGFLSHGDSGWILSMKEAQLNATDCNFFTIDWSACSSTLYYPDAVDCLPFVANLTAQMIDFICDIGTNVKNIQLIGHSLGSHIMGQVSQHRSENVGRITGLDPAGPLFYEDDLTRRIDPSDADFVDIIHTNRDFFGYEDTAGLWDFYPNGGHNQPAWICDHSMSHVYYTESISNTTMFPSPKCDSLKSAFKGNCNGTKHYMGVNEIKGPVGIYYIYLPSQLLKDIRLGLIIGGTFLGLAVLGTGAYIAVTTKIPN